MSFCDSHLFSPICQSCSSNDLSFSPKISWSLYRGSGFQFLAALRKLPSAVLGFCKFLPKLSFLALWQVDYFWYSKDSAKPAASLKYQPQPPDPTPSPLFLCPLHLSTPFYFSPPQFSAASSLCPSSHSSL